MMRSQLSNDDANDLADEILLREEFLPARDPGWFQRSVDRVISEVLEVIGRVLEALFGGAGSGVGVGLAYVLLALALVVLILAIARAFRGRITDDQDERQARVVFDEVVDAEDLERDLAAATASRDWRAAVIAGFRLAVLDLIDARLAVDRPGASIGDFDLDLQTRAPERLEAYRRASDGFERAFYSDLAVDEADHRAVVELRRFASVVAGGGTR